MKTASGEPDIPILHLVLIVALGIAVYGGTLNAPFYFDDMGYVIDNPVIRDVGLLVNPPEELGAGRNVERTMATRFMGYLSFALNYAVHGLDVRGYHAVNIILHMVNAALIYYLVMLMLGTPVMRPSGLAGGARMFALGASALFVAHPLMTQAVTYVSQRFALLLASEYLLAVVFYMEARRREPGAARAVNYGLSVLFALCAMFTKESAFTLPLALALVEFVFYEGRARERLARLSPFALMLPIIPVLAFGDEGLRTVLLGAPGGMTLEITRTEYMLTQFPVLATYLRLFLFPMNQNLDYDYPVYGTVFDARVMASVVVVASGLGAGVYALLSSRRRGYGVGIVPGFGVAWFYLTSSVESLAAPLADVIFEHRAYLPSVGLCIAAPVLAHTLAHTFAHGLTRTRRQLAAAAVVFSLAVALMATAAKERNDLWSDDILFWEDAALKSPGKGRVYHHLGNAYGKHGRLDEARAAYIKSIDLDPGIAESYTNVGNIHHERGDLGAAIEWYSKTLEADPGAFHAYYNLGIAYAERKEYTKAADHYGRAIEINPKSVEAYTNFGLLQAEQGLIDLAEAMYRTALDIDPLSVIARFNLGALLEKKGDLSGAFAEYRAVVGIDPGYARGYFALGALHERRDDLDLAVQSYETGLRIMPDSPEAHVNLGVIYAKQRRTEDARSEYLRALSIAPAHREARFNLGVIYERMERYDDAVAAYREVVSQWPDYHQARNNLGVSLMHLGRYREAVAEFRAAMEAEPGNPAYRHNMEIAVTAAVAARRR